MKQDLFFKGEIPALESDKEGKLRGGFCALGGDISFYSNNGCTDQRCGHTNNGCKNTCSPDSSDVNNGCTNDCGTTDNGCSHDTDKECTTPTNEQRGIGLSIFSLGTSTLF